MIYLTSNQHFSSISYYSTEKDKNGLHIPRLYQKDSLVFKCSTKYHNLQNGYMTLAKDKVVVV